MWGQVHEDIAVDASANQTKKRIEKIGLCLFECGILGSTPGELLISLSGEGGSRDMTIDE